jgi:hypothetical protein
MLPSHLWVKVLEYLRTCKNCNRKCLQSIKSFPLLNENVYCENCKDKHLWQCYFCKPNIYFLKTIYDPYHCSDCGEKMCGLFCHTGSKHCYICDKMTCEYCIVSCKEIYNQCIDCMEYICSDCMVDKTKPNWNIKCQQCNGSYCTEGCMDSKLCEICGDNRICQQCILTSGACDVCLEYLNNNNNNQSLVYKRQRLMEDSNFKLKEL